MKRPRKIYEEPSGELYILNKSGKKIYIKTSLNKKRVQKAFVKDYKKKKTKVIKPKRKITTYRNRPVLAKEISSAIVKILKEIKKFDSKTGDPSSEPRAGETSPSINDTKSSSGPAQNELGKDPIYMTTDERDNLLIKNIEKRRLDNLSISGIDLNPLLQAIGYESQSNNNRLSNIENMAADYKLQLTEDKKNPTRTRGPQIRGRPIGSKNKVKSDKAQEPEGGNVVNEVPLSEPLFNEGPLTAQAPEGENVVSEVPEQSSSYRTAPEPKDSIFFTVPSKIKVSETGEELYESTHRRYFERIMNLAKSQQSLPLNSSALEQELDFPEPKLTDLNYNYAYEKWYQKYKNQNKNDSEIFAELEVELNKKEFRNTKNTKSQRNFLKDYQNNLLGLGHQEINRLLTISKLYPDESLYESEIKTIMKNKNAVYCPVIARDEIDDIKVNTDDKPTFFVMNLSNRDVAGTHWVAVYIDKYDVNYFDSFGKPPDKDLKQKLLEMNDKSTKYNLTGDEKLPLEADGVPLEADGVNRVPINLKKFKYNKREIQDPLSSDCGYMSIEFLENLLEGESFAKATNFDEKEVQREIDKYEEEFV